MSTAFEILGISSDADTQQVRTAYRAQVKSCHPDQFMELAEQKQAQDRLVQLNLAYEEALKTASQKKVGFNLISQEEAKHFAIKLMEQGNLESALRQLNRADSKDGYFYYLQAQILMAMRQFDTAHQSYREAVKLEPENLRFRQGALDAAVALKKSKQPLYKVKSWASDILGSKRKTNKD